MASQIPIAVSATVKASAMFASIRWRKSFRLLAGPLVAGKVASDACGSEFGGIVEREGGRAGGTRPKLSTTCSVIRWYGRGFYAGNSAEA